jgi:hypothetical protein
LVAAAAFLLFPFFLSSCAVEPLSAIGFFLLSASFCYRLLSAIGFFLLSASFLFLKMYSSIPGGLVFGLNCSDL